MTKTFQTATIAAAGTADAEELRRLYHIARATRAHSWWAEHLPETQSAATSN